MGVDGLDVEDQWHTADEKGFLEAEFGRFGLSPTLADTSSRMAIWDCNVQRTSVEVNSVHWQREARRKVLVDTLKAVDTRR